jgi:hypothetical protein
MQAITFLICLILVILWIRSIFKIGRKIEISHIDIDQVKVDKKHFPYVKRYYLMTKAELSFYRELESRVKNDYYIVPQVLLSRLVEVEKQEVLWKTYNNKINKKSVDFVLFSKPYFNPVLVIELDDRSHNRYDRKTRDDFVDEVLKSVNIPIVHVKNSYKYDIENFLSIIKSESNINLQL